MKYQRLSGVFICVISAVLLLLASDAKAGLIIGAPKYAGLSQGLAPVAGGRSVGFWSFGGQEALSTIALDAVCSFAIMNLLTPPVQSFGFRRGFCLA